MIEVDNVYVSDDVVKLHFCCDISKCNGMCCIEGDAGAPLEDEEVNNIQENLDAIIPHMRKECVEIVQKNGVFDYDEDAEMVTPLLKNQDCVFVYYEKSIAKCAIEKAWEEGKIPFRKPISCHLYPIRLSKLKAGITAVNFHYWFICDDALRLGERKDIPVYIFLKEALIRKFGATWYNKLLEKINEHVKQ